ncbi:DUF5686 family protein [Salibacter sp.]|uniref:DUF5686 and carboxypeptidase-like regulatory domain-containing protein n=1 Tax=Salibacter sp. TaxID=2010995 RepID=UPI002870A1E1|nr:DUF5686 family protein [Salibacter sp.]MDR9488092.1 DUF5686 family protein [Salibacter sp.]
MKTSLRTYLYFALTLLLVSFSASMVRAQYTSVSGTVTDAKTGEPLPFVNISFVNKNIGTTTDLNGYYEIKTQWASDKLRASFVGYKPQERMIQPGEKQEVNFELKQTAEQLKEVEIKADKKKRYRNKDNPAVILIRNVLEHRDENRMNSENLEYLEYNKYTKDEYDLNNFTDKWTKRNSLRSFKIAFQYIDTSDMNGKPYIPILIKEKVSKIYFRSDPKAEKEVVKGLKLSGFENSVFGEGVSQFLDKLGSEVDIYDNTIDLLDKSFTSPISGLGPNVYRYYITDSMMIDGVKFKELSFIPRDPQLVAFTGKMLVGDSSLNYVVKEIEMNVDSRININFLEDLRINQEFTYHDSIGWILTKDKMTVDIQPADEGLGLYNTKTVSYDNFIINKPRADDIYSGLNNEVIGDSATERNDKFWEEMRHDTLTDQEEGIYQMADTIQSLPEFKTVANVGEFLLSGYTKAGPIDIGPITSFMSYNDVEGIRFRVGGRTNLNFHENWRFEGYGAYGINDERWKYSGTAEYYFSKTPLTKLHLSYTDDVFQPGFDVNWSDNDNIFLSLRRGPADNMLYQQKWTGYFQKEWFIGLQNTFRIDNKNLMSSAFNDFVQFGSDYTPQGDPIDKIEPINVTELTLRTRLAINEKFVQGRFARSQIKTTAPVFTFDYTYSPPQISDYEYHKLYLSITKRFKLGIFGFSDVEVEGNKIFGAVPYPLLVIHRGNETFTYDDRSFNLMNFVEFGSDQSASIMVQHHFNGLLTSNVPFMDRLKWRAVVSAKAVMGSLSDANTDTTNTDLVVLPEEMGTLERKPYVEVSAGIENILKLFRFDIVKRLTYLDNEGVSELWGVKGYGIRGKIQISF